MKLLNFHEIHMNSACFLEIQDLYVTETRESAESTKPYELQCQIGGISTQNHFLDRKIFFTWNTLFEKRYAPPEYYFLNAKSHFSAARGWGNVNSGYVFKF